MRAVHDRALYLAREIATSDAYVVVRRQRKTNEILFVHLKPLRNWIPRVGGVGIMQKISSTSPPQPITSASWPI